MGSRTYDIPGAVAPNFGSENWQGTGAPLVPDPSPPGPPGEVYATDPSDIDVPVGNPGRPGEQGPVGLPGPPGETFASDDSAAVEPVPGAMGPPGPPGPAGAAGPLAETFATDPSGEFIVAGPPGPPGPPGPAGASGPPAETFSNDDSAAPDPIPGSPGMNGANGAQGLQGPMGPPGGMDTTDAADSGGVMMFGQSQQTQTGTLTLDVQAASSAYTVPSNSLTTVPGVSFALAANKTYVYYFDGEMSSSNALGASINFASTYSGSVSRFLQAGILGSGNGTFDNPVNNTSGGELTANVAALVTGNWPFRIHGVLDTTSAGNLTLQVRRNNATVNVQLQGWVRPIN